MNGDHSYELKPVSSGSLSAFQNARDEIIRVTVERSLSKTEEVSHHGDEARRILTAGIDFTQKMLESAMEFGDEAMLEDEMRWAIDRLPHDGALPEHLVSRFRILRSVARGNLGADSSEEIVPYIEWMIHRIEQLKDASD